MLDINAYNDQVCTKMEPALLSSTKKLNHSDLITQPLRPCDNWNIGKYIEQTIKQCCHLPENHEWAVKILVLAAYL